MWSASLRAVSHGPRRTRDRPGSALRLHRATSRRCGSVPPPKRHHWLRVITLAPTSPPTARYSDYSQMYFRSCLLGCAAHSRSGRGAWQVAPQTVQQIQYCALARDARHEGSEAVVRTRSCRARDKMTSCLPEKGHDEGGASSSSTIEELLLSFSELATQYDISAMKGNVYTGAPLPKNEALRLKALEAYDVSEDNEYLDNLTETCRHVFNVPIALVSLVYGDRQFFHSRCGLGARESPRETSFCAWTLLPENPKVLLVEDASSQVSRADSGVLLPHTGINLLLACRRAAVYWGCQEQFKDNPLVLGPPYIRCVPCHERAPEAPDRL